MVRTRKTRKPKPFQESFDTILLGWIAMVFVVRSWLAAFGRAGSSSSPSASPSPSRIAGVVSPGFGGISRMNKAFFWSGLYLVPFDRVHSSLVRTVDSVLCFLEVL